MGKLNDRDIPHVLLGHYDHLGSMINDSLFSVNRGVGPDTFADALNRHAHDVDAALSLYIHIPFCAVRCLNCDKNTTVTHDPGRIDDYIDALGKEMAMVGEQLGRQRPVRQLRLGGGTPNYLTDTQLVRLVEIIDRHFGLDSDTDAALEANPCRASASQLGLLHGLGFRRIDFAIADLDPHVQLAIGRVQSAAMIADAFATAREVGFESVNLGLRYGLPQQSAATLERTVERLLSLAPDRISCEAYQHRPGGLGHQWAIDSAQANTSLASRLVLFHTVVEGLTSAGYQWIGLDCFARKNDQLSIAQTEHRLRRDWLGYTQQPASDFLGFGTNAISELGGLCTQNHLDVSRWQDAVEHHRYPVRGGLRLSKAQMKRRDAMCALMCNLEILDRDTLLGLDKQESEGDLWSDFVRRGLIDVLPDRLRLTSEGRHMLHHFWNGSITGPGVDGLSWQTSQSL
jgi:oxygen-independent coproporphyrinogen-3 oxidase